jgi:hypothetical protein
MTEAITGLNSAEMRALEQHIMADARWVAWVAARIRLHGVTSRAEPLAANGTIEAHPVASTKRLADALQDMRRRRLNAHAPHGWPVLSLAQRSLLVRSTAMAFQGVVRLDGDDARDLGRVLHCTGDLARMEWVPAVQRDGR